VKIINISGRYLKTVSMAFGPFESQMLHGASPFSQQTLVVAAAGNEGLEIARGQLCPIEPACYNNIYRNVISVIATNDNATAPSPAAFNSRESSNFGEHFDIAAPGLKVPSSAPLNRIAEMAGTSQAAPIVSGAAAHLYALRPAVLPGEIKNRLIWTSDLLPSLRKKVFGGRINIATAVNDVDSDVFRLKGGEILKGNLISKDRYSLQIISQDDDAQAMTIRINLSRVRRMFKVENNLWDMMWLDSSENDAPLVRKRVHLDGIKYRDDESDKILGVEEFQLQRNNKKEADVNVISEVVDFISSMR
jgi:hypothetical protein